MASDRFECSVPGLAGNENPVGNPVVGTIVVETDAEKLALQKRVQELEYADWYRKWGPALP